MIKLFISSVQQEFATERRELVAYIRQDAVLGRFFDPFLFEELPAKDVSAEQAYLSEVADSDVYLGLLGEKYGNEDAKGVSPTEREYDKATENHKYRIVLIKTATQRHPKENAFISRVEQDVVRNTFCSVEEMKSAVYAALVYYLILKGYLHYAPFDATLHQEASIGDLDSEKIRWWTGMAREKRNFPLAYSDDNIHKILSSLHLISGDERVSNAALLLFAKDPQLWFVSSTVKCVHFYGTKIQKPLVTMEIFGGTVFEVVDQAVAFVMSRIDSRVGERTESAQVDIQHELPVQAVTEAIVNAVVHRDYRSNGSVQVMLFKDRLEVWNPGRLPKGMTIKKLNGEHTSLPVNPLLANPVYLAGYIEQVGTGTNDLIDRCVDMGLRKPEFRQDEGFSVVLWRKTGKETGKETNSVECVDVHVLKLLEIVGKHTINVIEMMKGIGLKGGDNFRKNYLNPALRDGFLAMLYPDNPKRKGQAYYLTQKGLKVIEQKKED